MNEDRLRESIGNVLATVLFIVLVTVLFLGLSDSVGEWRDDIAPRDTTEKTP